jgi:serine phosphatase RsbU (regulator of sigma subunit)
MQRVIVGAGDVVTQARALVVQRAVEVGRPDLADDVALVTSELVTNAEFHGGGCTGFEVVPIDAGLRVEVRDSSQAPPLLGHPSDESLTGRGVRLIAHLSARWGVTPEGRGKVVWAEVTGEHHGVGDGVSEDDLLAMWGDDEWDDHSPDGRRRHHIELGDIPTDLLLAAKSHVENLVREFVLASRGADTGISGDVPPRLTALLGAVTRFAEARLSIKRQALDAVRRSEAITRLALDLPADAADDAEAYLHALDEIDGYSRAMRLLTLETPPQHRLFRQWYVGELVAQLRAVATGTPPPPTQPFERRILEELDHMASMQRASERAARLYSVAAALATADSPEAVAEAVLNEGVAALRAAAGGVLLSTEEDTLALPGAVGYDEAVLARLRSESLDAELPAAVALRTGEPVWLESRSERDRRFPELVGLEPMTVSLCAVPLEVQGQRLGALRFSFTDARLFDEDERRFVVTLAAQTAQALHRTQLHQARLDAGRRLQQSLLPRRLPEIPGVEVAAIYHPFGDGMEVGGDFYDLWPIGPQRWAVAIGDASGTGPEAAALTALVRHTVRALTMIDPDPERVVQRLNTALHEIADPEDERFCTVLFGVIEAIDGLELLVAGGGHPPLVVRRADGTLETLLVGGSIIGVFPDAVVETVRTALHPGDTVLFMTDGVLEARCEGRLFGLDGVERVLAAEVASAEAAVLAVERAVLEHTGHSLGDDMAAVVLRALP